MNLLSVMMLRPVRCLSVTVLLVITTLLPAVSQVITVRPERPRPGDTVMVTYHPSAPGARLSKAGRVVLQLVPFARPSVRNAVSFNREYEMDRVGTVWKKRMVFSDSSRPFFLMFFTDPVTNLSDSLTPAARELMLYGSNGKPLPCAHILRYYARVATRRYNPDSLRAAELAIEKKYHPANYRADAVRWSGEFLKSGRTPEFRKEFHARVDSLARISRNSLDGLVACALGYRMTGDTVRAAQCEFRILALYPSGTDAEILLFNWIRQMKDPEQQANQYHLWLTQHPASELGSTVFSALGEYYRGINDTTPLDAIKADWLTHLQEKNATGRMTLPKSDTLIGPDHRMELQLFRLVTAEGAKVTRDTLTGKVVVLAFWSSWSSGSAQVLAELQKMHEHYGADGPVSVIAIVTPDVGETKADALKYFAARHLTIPCLFDVSAFAREILLTSVPAVLILDTNGNIAYRSMAPMDPSTVASQVGPAVERLLKEQQ